LTSTSESAPATILCLCSGNYCRSPLAEGFLRARLAVRHNPSHFCVASAGTTRHHEGQPPAPWIIQLVQERTQREFTHAPHRVTPDEVAEADLILAMAEEHRDWIAAHYPDALRRTMLLSEAIGQTFDIPDPGEDATVTLSQTADLIERCVRDGLGAIAARAQARQTRHA